MPVSSSRVSPYPLRSCRNKKQKGVNSPVESESVSEYEDVRCVICMEPPHNAVLLECSSFAKGCRAYMCDTTARHSNCYKQYRREKSRSRCGGGKILNCPYCRGEVQGITKPTCARRFMNAKPRCCSVDKCEFSGTYAQLKNHMKTVHPGLIQTRSDSWERRMWEQMERELEYREMLHAHQRLEAEQRFLASSIHQLPYGHDPLIDLNLDAIMNNGVHEHPSLHVGPSMIMHNLFLRESRAISQASTDFHRLGFHGYPRWTP